MRADADRESLEVFAGKRVLLTGDSGFKGSWLALWLAELGAEVTGLSLPPAPHNLLFASARVGFRHVDGDIRDLDLVVRALKDARPDFVFHLAGQALVRRSYAEPQATFATNLIGSVNVLEAVRHTDGIRALVYVTTDHCYRDRDWLWGYRENDELGGRDPYAASKACAELALKAYRESFFSARSGLGTASARAGNVIGGGDRAADRVVPDAVAALESGRAVRLRNPAATRSWLHVLDPLCGYLELAAALARDPVHFSGAWNFGPAEDGIRSVEDLARTVVAAWGAGRIEHAAELSPPHEAAALHLSSEKARRELGWRAIWGFERAAGEAVRWYRAVAAGKPPAAAALEQIASYTHDRAAALPRS